MALNELLHARALVKDMDGTWKVLDHMKSANIAVNAVTCSILLKGLTAHTHHCDIKRVLDLVLEIGTGGDPADHDLPEDEGSSVQSEATGEEPHGVSVWFLDWRDVMKVVRSYSG